MRFSLAVVLLAASLSAGAAFAPAQPANLALARYSPSILSSTVEADAETAVEETSPSAPAAAAASAAATSLTGAEIVARLDKQLAKLAGKDATSPQLSKEVSHFLLGAVGSRCCCCYC